MVNKRGQLFSLLMVFFTLFLCGVVIALYFVYQGNISASLVSPKDVLELRDEVSMLELREIELIESSFQGASGVFGSDEFESSFRVNFIEGVMRNENMTNFLFENLFVWGIGVKEQEKNRNLLENGIYPERLMSSDENEMNFGRARIEKRVLLRAKDEGSIDFPVYFTFEFGRGYLIDKNGEVTKV